MEQKEQISASINDQIDQLEAVMRSHVPVDCPLTHTFTESLYTRRIFMPAGTLVVSKIHKTRHPYRILEGVALVKINDSDWERLEAKHEGTTEPGTRRILLIEEDCVWETDHALDKAGETLEEIEERIIEKRENVYIGNEKSLIFLKRMPELEVPGRYQKKGLYLCHCGKTFVSLISAVKSGHSKSCGCTRINILKATTVDYNKGDKLGSCIYVEDVESDAHVGRKAKFICYCGNEFVSRISPIKRGKTKSCGCLTEEKQRQHHPKKPIPHLSDEEINRFWSFVDIVPDNNVCWNWTGKSERYGEFNVNDEKYKANRVSYFITTGVDPEELSVMHSCDNPKCCNPNHLSLGTHDDNMKDAARKGRFKNRKKKSV